MVNFIAMTMLNGVSLFINPSNIVGFAQLPDHCSVQIEWGGKREIIKVKEKCYTLAKGANL
jgi:uncharacterized protein YlzI (FlbEa/FlbD family)